MKMPVFFRPRLSILAHSALCSAAILVLVSVGAHAAVLVQYDFTNTFTNNNTNTASSAASTTVANTTASAFATNGMVGVRSTSSPSSTGNPSFAVTTTQMGGSIDTNEYLNFSLSADSGYVLNLSSLSFAVANAGSAPLPNGQWQVRSSLDNYATSLGTFSSNTTTSTFETKSVSLTGSQFQNLSSIQFRFYLWDLNNSNIGTKALRTDTVTLEGAVVVIPEPSSIALLLGGVGMLVCLRRLRGSR